MISVETNSHTTRTCSVDTGVSNTPEADENPDAADESPDAADVRSDRN